MNGIHNNIYFIPFNLSGNLSVTDFQSSFKRLLWWIFISTRGGEMRIKIIRSLIEGPKNANRLSSSLGVNYRTVEHHMKVLLSNNLVMVQGDGYGKVYFPGPVLINNIKILQEIFMAAGIKGEI